VVSPPPGLPRWSADWSARNALPATPRRHRACPGGAPTGRLETRCPQRPAATGLAPVERRLVARNALPATPRRHRACPGGAPTGRLETRWPQRPAATGLAPVERRLVG